mmetsp:Transcript_89619/g.214205  ORF Transcript_89619/g.214205 Transcript_89619/m.214205 type:complete len:616 (-) Transcript_89619:932-2779(-)
MGRSLALPGFAAALLERHKALSALLAEGHAAHAHAAHAHAAAHAAHAAHGTAHAAHGAHTHGALAEALLGLALAVLALLAALGDMSRDLQLGALVAHVKEQRPVPSALLCDLHKDLRVLDLLVQQRLQDLVLVEENAVLRQLHQLRLRLHPEVLGAQRLGVVAVEVEAQVLQDHALAVWVVAVLLEGMSHKLQLEAQGHQSPILHPEVLVQGHASPNVIHLVNAEDVNALKIHILLFFLLLLICLVLLLLFFHILLLLLGLHLLVLLSLFRLLLGLLGGRLHLRQLGGLCLLGLLLRLLLRLLLLLLPELLLLLLPLLEHLLPGPVLLLEPGGGRQVLHPARQLPIHDPLLQEGPGLLALRPLVDDVVEALRSLGQGELGEAGVQHRLRHVRHRQLPEGGLLFLWRQLHFWGLFIRFHLFDVLLLLLLDLVLHFDVLLLLLLFRELLSFRLSLLLLGFFLGLLLRFLHLRHLFQSLLLRLLLGLLRLLGLLLDGSLARLLVLLLLELEVGLLLLVLQHQLQGLLLEVRGGVPNDHAGLLLEAAVKEAGQALRALLLDEVAPHLHHHVVPLLQRRHGLDHPLDAHILHLGDAELGVRLVVGGDVLLEGDAALLRPV